MSPLKDLKCDICFEITERYFRRETELQDWVCPKCGAVGKYKMMPSVPGLVRLKTPFHEIPENGEGEK